MLIRNLALATSVGAVSQGPGIEWVGINGGYRETYTDASGRVWQHPGDPWAPDNWGGYVGEPSRTYTNTLENDDKSPRRCVNWPPEFDNDADFTAMFQHLEQKDGNLTLRANLQAADQPTSYYTVSFMFCEKHGDGGSFIDLLVNGKYMKYQYVTKHHHGHIDIYHWKCVPTVDGQIEFTQLGEGRFSIVTMQKSIDGCDKCNCKNCNEPKGFCSPSSVDDRSETAPVSRVKGHPSIYNEADFVHQGGTCRCDLNVMDEACATVDACLTTNCNQPFGTCHQGVCTCLNGYSGQNCEIPPDTCDTSKCEFCMPAGCKKDWCATLDCSGHGTCDPGDPRLCKCSDGYSGTKCDVPLVQGCTIRSAPNFNADANVDDGSCEQPAVAIKENGGLRVATVHLPKKIAGMMERPFKEGPADNQSVPQRMVSVADKRHADILYIGWTEDLPWGTSSSDGAVHLTKLNVSDLLAGQNMYAQDKVFSGFVKNGGMDVSPEGRVGMLCAKFVKGWMDEDGSFKVGAQCPKSVQEEGPWGCPWYPRAHNTKDQMPWSWHFYDTGYAFNPLALAVCEIDGDTMELVSDPWLMGNSYIQKDGLVNGEGTYATRAYQSMAGDGYLLYNEHRRQWEAVWGATYEAQEGRRHQGGKARDAAALFVSKSADGCKTDSADWGLGICMPGLKNREQESTNIRGYCGGHETRVTLRYHPTTQTVGAFCQGADNGYHFQIEADGERQVVGNKQDSAGGVRPCCDGNGRAWVVAYASKDEHPLCMRLGDKGDKNKIMYNGFVKLSNDKVEKGFVKIATLGESESTASCGRFLIGWVTKDTNKWMLAEVDGNCQVQSGFPIDVTNVTRWDSQAEWSTTKDGLVTWVSAWEDDDNGQPVSGQGNNRHWWYGMKPRQGRKDWEGNQGYDGWNFTRGFVTNQARISIYRTEAKITKDEYYEFAKCTPPGPPPAPSTTCDPEATQAGAFACDDFHRDYTKTKPNSGIVTDLVPKAAPPPAQAATSSDGQSLDNLKYSFCSLDLPPYVTAFPSSCTPPMKLAHGSLCVYGYQCKSNYCCPNKRVCLTDAAATVSRNDVASKLKKGVVNKDGILDMIFQDEGVQGGVCKDPWLHTSKCMMNTEGLPSSEWDQLQCGCKEEYIMLYKAGGWVSMNEAGCSNAVDKPNVRGAAKAVGEIDLAAVPSGMMPLAAVFLSFLI